MSGYTKDWAFRYFIDPVGKNLDNFHLLNGPEGDPGGSILEGAIVCGTHSDAVEIGRLIVAAPDMLEALKALYSRYVECIGNEGPEALAARAAIQKAEGQDK